MTGPDEISGRKAAGISGRVTVKDKIEYKKVDVTDEIQKGVGDQRGERGYRDCTGSGIGSAGYCGMG